jgi:hypothetical protein
MNFRIGPVSALLPKPAFQIVFQCFLIMTQANDIGTNLIDYAVSSDSFVGQHSPIHQSGFLQCIDSGLLIGEWRMSFPFQDIVIPGNDGNDLITESPGFPKKPSVTGMENVECAEYKYSRHDQFTVGAL